MNSSTVIDAHAMLGHENHLALEADELLRRMDKHGIACAIARPMGAEMVVLNREGNNRVLTAHPRIKGLATANPWYGDQAIDELRRCYDLGAVGLYLHPARQGLFPTDPQVQPIIELVSQWNWPVMIVTGTYPYGDVHAVAIVARQYPDTTFIAGFSGFTDMWFELPGVMASTPNLIMDTALIWGTAISQIVQSHGAERILYASGEPRNRYQTTLNMMDRMSISDADRKLIQSENARRIFHLADH